MQGEVDGSLVVASQLLLLVHVDFVAGRGSRLGVKRFSVVVDGIQPRIGRIRLVVQRLLLHTVGLVLVFHRSDADFFFLLFLLTSSVRIRRGRTLDRVTVDNGLLACRSVRVSRFQFKLEVFGQFGSSVRFADVVVAGRQVVVRQDSVAGDGDARTGLFVGLRVAATFSAHPFGSRWGRCCWNFDDAGGRWWFGKSDGHAALIVANYVIAGVPTATARSLPFVLRDEHVTGVLPSRSQTAVAKDRRCCNTSASLELLAADGTGAVRVGMRVAGRCGRGALLIARLFDGELAQVVVGGAVEALHHRLLLRVRVETATCSAAGFVTTGHHVRIS